MTSISSGIVVLAQEKLGRGRGFVQLGFRIRLPDSARLISQTPNTEGGRVGSFYFSQERSVTDVRRVWPGMPRHILLRAMAASPLESSLYSLTHPSRVCNPAYSEPKTLLKSAAAQPFFRNGFFPVMPLSLDLKVPKWEIFDPFFFTSINPIWVGNLRTGEKKNFFRRPRQIFAILFLLRRLSLR